MEHSRKERERQTKKKLKKIKNPKRERDNIKVEGIEVIE